MNTITMGVKPTGAEPQSTEASEFVKSIHIRPVNIEPFFGDELQSRLTIHNQSILTWRGNWDNLISLLNGFPSDVVKGEYVGATAREFSEGLWDTRFDLLTELRTLYIERMEMRPQITLAYKTEQTKAETEYHVAEAGVKKALNALGLDGERQGRISGNIDRAKHEEEMQVRKSPAVRELSERIENLKQWEANLPATRKELDADMESIKEALLKMVHTLI